MEERVTWTKKPNKKKKKNTTGLRTTRRESADSDPSSGCVLIRVGVIL